MIHHPSLPRTSLVLPLEISYPKTPLSPGQNEIVHYPVWVEILTEYLFKLTFKKCFPGVGKIRSRIVSKTVFFFSTRKKKNPCNDQVALGIWNIHWTSLYDFQVFAAAFVKTSISKGKRTICLRALHLSKDTLPTWKEIKATLCLWGDPAVIPLQI